MMVPNILKPCGGQVIDLKYKYPFCTDTCYHKLARGS